MACSNFSRKSRVLRKLKAYATRLWNARSVTEPIAEVTDVELENLGSSTYKHMELGIGVEPDACFYVHNALRRSIYQ